MEKIYFCISLLVVFSTSFCIANDYRYDDYKNDDYNEYYDYNNQNPEDYNYDYSEDLNDYYDQNLLAPPNPPPLPVPTPPFMGKMSFFSISISFINITCAFKLVYIVFVFILQLDNT